MIEAVAAADAATRAGFDAVVDARSPSEFAEDHVPGAINLPVLSDDERAEVGTLYARASKFEARRVGAAYVSRNVAAHLEGPLAAQGGGWRPLLYCWRGGQRSAAMATVMSQVGWRVGLLQGGYRTYRRAVVASLYDSRAPIRLVLLRGPTGVGKTELLARLAQRGAQALDLEALAGHRGSLFGARRGEAQPPQKGFESRLAEALDGFDPSRAIFVEAESSRIGDLQLPPRLWAAMQGAPAIALDAPLDLRARRIAAEYGETLERPAEVQALLARLPRHHGREDRAGWSALAVAGDAAGLARALLAAHYDPAYARSAATAGEEASLGRLEVGEDLEAAASAILARPPPA